MGLYSNYRKILLIFYRLLNKVSSVKTVSTIDSDKLDIIFLTSFDLTSKNFSTYKVISRSMNDLLFSFMPLVLISKSTIDSFLNKSEFNSYKSQLKIIESGFHKKPIIASETMPYTIDLKNAYKEGKLLDDGNALLVHENKMLENQEESAQFKKWYIRNIEFSNFLSYGENQRLDFDNLNGIVVIESNPPMPSLMTPLFLRIVTASVNELVGVIKSGNK